MIYMCIYIYINIYNFKELLMLVFRDTLTRRSSSCKYANKII